MSCLILFLRIHFVLSNSALRWNAYAAINVLKLKDGKAKVQFRGLDLQTNQVTVNDKVNPSAIFKSANDKITLICITFKAY